MVSTTCGDGVQRVVEMFRISTPIGDMLTSICPVGLHMINQKEDINDENFMPDRSIDVSLLTEASDEELVNLSLDCCMNWLKSYFHDLPNLSKIKMPLLCPLSRGGSRFGEKVLMTLAKSVPPGKTITYAALASLAGSPGAQQAVGTAMACNPFQLIVPCHRVVKSGQKVGKYSGGCRNSVKVWLLQHEGLNVDQNGTVCSMR